MLRIVKSCITYVILDQVCFCKSWLGRRSDDHGAILERGRFDGIPMVRYLWSRVQTFHLGRMVRWSEWSCSRQRDLPVPEFEYPPLVLTAWGGRIWAWWRVECPLLVLTAWDGRTWYWWWWGSIERPPLILIVLGGRTRTHLWKAIRDSKADASAINCCAIENIEARKKGCVSHLNAFVSRKKTLLSQYRHLGTAICYCATNCFAIEELYARNRDCLPRMNAFVSRMNAFVSRMYAFVSR